MAHAVETLGRRCYAMEIDPKYVQVAIERWLSPRHGGADKSQVSGAEDVQRGTWVGVRPSSRPLQGHEEVPACAPQPGARPEPWVFWSGREETNLHDRP